MGVFTRGTALWIRYRDVDGSWKNKPTGLTTEQRELAQAAYEDVVRRVRAATASGEVTATPLVETVRRYVPAWLDKRRESDHDWKHDKGKLTKHVLPHIGDMKLADVRTRHIAELVHTLRFKTEPRLANRTVRNIYSVVSALFRDAAIEGKIETDPCILTDQQLGPVVDKDPEWRAGAFFTRDEAETMISHPEIPFDRQVVYGFGVLAGLRPGEAAALRWKHYDASAEPLGKLTVAKAYNTKRAITKSTKTEAVKIIPVHPTLAAMLAEWKLHGWEEMTGRAPEPEDLIIPLPPTTIAKRTKRTGEPFRGYDYSGKRWREVDLPMLGWRERSLYDTRATFITLACDEDGADREIIKTRVTHTPAKRDAFDGYARGTRWRETCAEVAKLRIVRKHRPTGNVIAMPRAVGAELVTSLVTSARNTNESCYLLAPEEGFEGREFTFDCEHLPTFPRLRCNLIPACSA